MFQGPQASELEASFKEFLARPENREVVEVQQRKEMRQALKMQQTVQAMELREKVLQAEQQAQKNVAPYLKNRVLRKIVATFTNDPASDFSRWACNPQVLSMLAEAKRLMDEGYVPEEEMERLLMAQLQKPKPELAEEAEKVAAQPLRLPTDQLVPYLNEQLTERRKGNELYKSRHAQKALEHYRKAETLLSMVAGLSAADQAEIDGNMAAVKLNSAAAHLALHEYGAAVASCSAALELEPNSVKGLLRRASAYTGRHELQSAEADLDRVEQLEPGSAAAAEVRGRLQRTAEQGRRSEQSTYASMFGARP